MTHVHLQETAVFVIRYGVILARPAFHHFFHKAAEHQIHLMVHRVGFLALMMKWCKFLPDAAMIGILIILDAVVEDFSFRKE